jgi:hypothetical protein
MPYYSTSGVRQGSVISPILFSMYVDDLLNKFKSYGCSFHGLSVSAIMYADDLVLASSSIHEMQLMLDMCCNELMNLDLRLNYDKSVALRIGKGCNKICCNIKAMGHTIKRVTEAKYLRIYIRSGQKLVHSIALPILTYGLEALSLTKTQLLSVEHPWSRMFMKLFKTFNLAIIQQWQYLCDLLPIKHLYTMHGICFLDKLDNSSNSVVYHIHELRSAEHDSVSNLAEKYNCNKVVFAKFYNRVVRSQFKQETFP